MSDEILTDFFSRLRSNALTSEPAYMIEMKALSVLVLVSQLLHFHRVGRGNVYLSSLPIKWTSLYAFSDKAFR